MSRLLRLVSLSTVLILAGSCTPQEKEDALARLDRTLATAAELIVEATGEASPTEWDVGSDRSDWCLRCSISGGRHYLTDSYDSGVLDEFMAAALRLGLDVDRARDDQLIVRGDRIYPISIWWHYLEHRVEVVTSTGDYIDPEIPSTENP